MFFVASSITCGEMTGIIFLEKQAARITPAAPSGEFNPAKMALVSRNTRNFFGIFLLPDIVPRSLESLYDGVLIIWRATLLLFGQTQIRLDFEPLYLPFKIGYFLENGYRYVHNTIVDYAYELVNRFTEKDLYLRELLFELPLYLVAFDVPQHLIEIGIVR
jgi:hypothetical protein